MSTIEFQRSERSTIGIEWELALVDKDSGDLRQVAQTILDAVTPEGGGQHPHIRQELLLNTVEIVTGVCRTVKEAGDDLALSIEQLRGITDPLRVELMCAGTHPLPGGQTRKSPTNNGMPPSSTAPNGGADKCSFTGFMSMSALKTTARFCRSCGR